MGAWADLLISIKNSIAGPVPFGGTIFPTSDNFPTMAAQLLKGGFFTLDTLEQLADIPYQNLQLDQEVVVRESPTHLRTRYRLITLPLPDTRISDIPGYNILDFWEPVSTGGSEEPGPPGDTGWTPYFGLENDGPNRVVMRLAGWFGGTGLMPAVPPVGVPPDFVYIGVGGFITKSGAINLKGDKGNAGDVLTVRPERYYTAGVRALTLAVPPPQGNWPPGGVAKGAFVSIQPTLTVVNDWTQPRGFMVSAQVPVSNDLQFDYWAVHLLANNVIVDVNQSGANFVNSIGDAPIPVTQVSSRTSVHKIPLHHYVVIPAGQQVVYGCRAALVEGGKAYIGDVFFEAFGL